MTIRFKINIMDLEKWGSKLTQTILIVEDELSIVTLLKYNLEKGGFRTDVAFDGEDALKKINRNSYDLVILDVMLPKFDGLQICKYVRKDNNLVPILMVTALDSEDDITDGLDCGADDYITKPFSPKELLSRINAILRRVNNGAEKKIQLSVSVGDLIVYPERFEAYFKGDQLSLTRKEYELLVYLMENKDLVLSRDQLLNAVWDYDIAGDTRIVDVHIARLREKIEIDKKHPQYIITVHGFGYKMTDPLIN